MDPKVEKYRRTRGAILKLLAFEHPGSIDQIVLHRLLDDLNITITFEELKSHIAYLEEKHCIRIDRRKIGRVELTMITICANGLDALDGIHTECGVDTEF